MLTVDEIKQLAGRAAKGDAAAGAIFRSLAIDVGILRRPGGWIYLPGRVRPFAHGWQAAARCFAVTAVTHTGRDLLVEMSKRSVSIEDLAAAYAEALADAAAYEQNAAYIAPVPRQRPEDVHDAALRENMLRGVDNTPGGRRREDAYARFVELADSGGPGTSKGLLAAVEAATTVRRPALCMAVVTVMRRMPRGATSADAVTLLLERALHDLGFAVEGDR